jgi:hypothetical protein
MTLYHYVRNKDELIELIDDAIIGEVLVPDGEMPPDWREAMAEIARRTRATFRRHPWTIEIPPATEGGPNGIRHFEQSLEAVSGSGLSDRDAVDLIFIVDDYAFGAALRENMISDGSGEGVRSDWVEGHLARFSELDPGEYPRLHEFFSGSDPREVFERLLEPAVDDTRFERGLQILLDGIESRIERGWRSD